MRLYLVQHGKAVEKKLDPDRPLTPEGAREVDSVGAFLSPRQLDIPVVWHSGKTRARQTAGQLAKCVAQHGAVEQRDGLAPNDDVRPLAADLRAREEDAMVVGHMPFLSRLASLLLAGDKKREVVGFTNAGVVCLERNDQGDWQVKWIVTPELVGQQPHT